jgi:hypothetical protein
VLNLPGYKRDANQNYTKISSPQLEWSCSMVITTTNAGKDVAKRNPYTLLGECKLRQTLWKAVWRFL